MKVILCGVGEPARNILLWLSRLTSITELGLFTHKNNLIEDDLTELAEYKGIFHTTDNINDAPLPFEPDMIISIYYRTIIKPHIINRVNGKIFNCHCSLLPRHRGRSPVPWAIVGGDTFSGITYHYIDKGVDTGRIILQAAVQIEGDDTQASLFAKLNRMVLQYFPAAFRSVSDGFEGVEQIGTPSHHPRGVPYDGQIDNSWPIAKIERFIRAMTYPPLPGAQFNGEEILTFDDYRQALMNRWIEEHAKRYDSVTFA